MAPSCRLCLWSRSLRSVRVLLLSFSASSFVGLVLVKVWRLWWSFFDLALLTWCRFREGSSARRPPPGCGTVVDAAAARRSNQPGLGHAHDEAPEHALSGGARWRCWFCWRSVLPVYVPGAIRPAPLGDHVLFMRASSRSMGEEKYCCLGWSPRAGTDSVLERVNHGAWWLSDRGSTR